MRILIVTFALVAAVAGVSDAALVTMNVTPDGGGAGIDQYDFWLYLVVADGDFLNARLTVEMDSACIRDPLPGNTTGGTAVPVDTWVNTVFDYKYDTGTSMIYNVYDPVTPPPPFDLPPVAVLDWSFYDTFHGDDYTYTPSLIARVLVDEGCVGTADMLVFTAATAGVGVNYHFNIPPIPTLPPGVLAAAIRTDANIDYCGTVESDSQIAANYAQLPITAYVKHTAGGSSMLVKGQARSYYDAAGIHHTIGAISDGQDFPSDLSADGTLTISKTVLVSPSSVGLPAGTPIYATGKLTFNGLLKALREEGEGWPSAEGLKAIFSAQVIKTGPSSDVVCFNGSVSLLGVSGESWIEVVLTGDADTAALRLACEELTLSDDLAYLFLDHVFVDFSVPAVVGQVFDVDIIFRAESFVPSMAAGLRAEVAFGNQLTPDPSGVSLLLAGGLLALWRRNRRRLN